MPQELRVGLLGETLLTRDSKIIRAGGPRRAAIVALLALRAPLSVSRPEFAAALWGEDPPASLVNTLHVHISALRRRLGRDAIQTAGEAYRLGAGVAVDVAEFRHAVARGADQLARGHAAGAADTLRGALGLWRGPPLADLGDATFAAEEAARLELMRLDAIEDRVKADLLLGRHRDVIGELGRLVADHPLHEGLRGLLMKALYRAGRQAEALAAYDSGRRLLRDEVGLDPSQALSELHHQLLTQTEEAPVRVAPPTAPTWRLPVLLDETIGREAEIATLTKLLVDGHSRLVTVLGAGGVGKSRIAVAVGERAGALLPDGVVFVPLAQAEEPADVAVTICAALGVRTGDDPLATLESVLSSRRMLLICDNFEHVLEAASVLARLLTAAPGLRILATTRQPVGLRGERRFMLRPLAEADSADPPSSAARLFIARAAAADPSFEPTAADLTDIAEIARRCDGLPLALELAAAKIRTMPVAELRRRMDSPLTLLTGEGTDAPDRQRTLRASIAWSMSALDDGHRQLLARLAIFRGGFTLTAAASAGDIDVDTALGCIEVLSDHGLLRRIASVSGTPRFDLLQTIQEYAASLLDAAERSEVQQRHAEHYRSWMRPIDEPGKSSASVEVWLAQMAERANLRQAIRWSLSGPDGGLAADLVVTAAPVWDQAGPRAEMLTWLHLLMDRTDLSAGRRCDACWWRAALVADSDPSLMAAPLAEARQLAEDTGDTRRLAWVHLMEAVAELYRDRPAQAAEELSSSAALAGQHPEAVNLQISLLMTTGHLSTVRGADLASAVEHTEKALGLARLHHRDLRAMTLLNNLSEIMLVEGEPARARELAHEGLELAERAQSQDGIAANLSQRGYADLLSGNFNAAQADLRAALNGHVQLGTTYYALHDAVRLAAALALSHPELAALALGVVEACPQFVDQPSSLQARDRCLADLETRLGERLAAELARGHRLVTQRGEMGALACVHEATEQAVME